MFVYLVLVVDVCCVWVRLFCLVVRLVGWLRLLVCWLVGFWCCLIFRILDISGCLCCLAFGFVWVLV